MTDSNVTPDVPPTPEGAADNVVPLTTPEAQIAALQAELAATKDQALRALAEAENTRRRAERDREDSAKYAISNFAKSLLGVADNFRRALEAAGDAAQTDPKIAALMEGVAATERELLAAFDRVGIKKIPALDLPFNANFHEVMFEAALPGKAPGTVFQVIEEGYLIHDRLLRPARVGVTKGDAGAPPPSHAIDQQA